MRQRLRQVMVLSCAGLLSACASLTPPAASDAASKESGANPHVPPFTQKPIPASPAATPAVPAAAPPARVASATPPGAPAARPPTPPGVAVAAAPTPAPRPFADVVKDASTRDGFIPLWSKDDKLWLELKPEHFGKPFFLQTNISRGVMANAATSTSRAMLQSHLVQFRKVGQNVQMLAQYTANTAQPGSPLAAAAAEGTSESLLAAAPLQSLPHPERKSVLVDASALFLADLPMYTQNLDAAHRMGYTLDRPNSYIHESQTRADALVLDVAAHFSVARFPLPTPPLPTGAPNPVQPTPLTGLADARSFFVGFYYTLAPLPATPMRPRMADGRVGHFNQRIWDFTDNGREFPRHYVVKRWRLEKKDPSAALSEPVQPITYWMDKNIPLAYRDTVRAGILEWNKAFERIGFKDAIRVEQQAADATWSTHDARHASVRWYVDHSDGALAVGPSTMDPRTGEILDADITLGNGWVTLARRYAAAQAYKPLPTGHAAHGVASGASEPGLTDSADIGSGVTGSGGFSTTDFVADADGVPTFLARKPGATGASRLAAHGALGHSHASQAEADLCTQQSDSLHEANFALDLLALRAADGGQVLTPAEAERVVHAILKETVTHEVGHTLGLRHNFRASTIYPQAKLNDPAFTRVNSMGGSVMDYNAFNFALESEPQGEVAASTLGPYDYWAIEYAYKPLPADQEPQALEQIARRGATDPLLAYGTDEELNGGGDGMDPEVNQRDLGADPLLYAQRRVKLTQEMWARLQRRALEPGQPYDVLTRNFSSGLTQLGAAMGIAAKYVGGVVYLRDQAGSRRAPMAPVSAARQRQAVKLITDNLLSLDGFALKPEFTSRLVDSALDRGFTPPMDRSLDASLLGLQTSTLDRLLSTPVAERIQNARHKLPSGGDAYTLAELYQSLYQAVWQGGPGASAAQLTPVRRALQREYVRRVAAAITRPAGGSATGDARALLRMQAKDLLAHSQRALAQGHLPLQTRAHLDEVADTLRAALQANATRALS